jgi:hypothetical protein
MSYAGRFTHGLAFAAACVAASAQYQVTVLGPGYARGVYNGNAVGEQFEIGFGGHAYYWPSSGGLVDLNPPGASQSHAYAVFRDQQVGTAYLPVGHAVIWHGSPSNLTDLHVSAYIGTVAFATDGVQQAGYGALPNNRNNAVVWSGTAASYVDLAPPQSPRAEQSGERGVEWRAGWVGRQICRPVAGHAGELC